MKGKLALALMGLPLIGAAQTFNDNFDAGTSAGNWTTYLGVSTANYNVNYAFDYSTRGIPSAPNSTGGSTMGLMMQANLNGSGSSGTAIPGLSVAPTGGSFTGDVTLQFDAWSNVLGPLPTGGNGTTHCLTGGIMASSGLQTPQGPLNGLVFAATGDGGSGSDYRAYKTPGAVVATTAGSGVTYAAGSLNNSAAYYSGLQGHTPAAQNLLAPATQVGDTQVGALGMAWYTWTIKKVGNTVTWSVNGNGVNNLLIATADLTILGPRGGNNITLGTFDTTSAPSTNAAWNTWNFQLIDNVQVVPEPGTMAALGLGAVALMRRRRSK